MAASGQYGIQNPLFMYQGTLGAEIQAAVFCGDAEDEAAAFTAAPAQTGTIRCGTM